MDLYESPAAPTPPPRLGASGGVEAPAAGTCSRGCGVLLATEAKELTSYEGRPYCSPACAEAERREPWWPKVDALVAEIDALHVDAIVARAVAARASESAVAARASARAVRAGMAAARHLVAGKGPDGAPAYRELLELIGVAIGERDAALAHVARLELEKIGALDVDELAARAQVRRPRPQLIIERDVGLVVQEARRGEKKLGERTAFLDLVLTVKNVGEAVSQFSLTKATFNKVPLSASNGKTVLQPGESTTYTIHAEFPEVLVKNLLGDFFSRFEYGELGASPKYFIQRGFKFLAGVRGRVSFFDEDAN